MAGWTNKGKFRMLGYPYLAATIPTNFFIALVTSATTPDADTNTFADLTEITAGNGYTAGGTSLTPGATDFDVHTEDDTNDKGLVQLRDIVYTASGGSIPASGSGARFAILTDDNGTQANREVMHFWDLSADRTVTTGQTLTLQDCEIAITES